MIKYRIIAVLIILLSSLLGYFIYSSEISENSKFKFKYGLDLNGGTSLIYRADVSQLEPNDIDNAMDTLRRTIERRVNIFGVSEPLVQTETGSSFSEEKDKHRLVVELPGVTNTQEAIDSIGKTPLLEFRLMREDIDPIKVQEQIAQLENLEDIKAYVLSTYQPAVLTGGNLARANLVFDPTTRRPLVTLDFDSEGNKIFEQVTGNNIGKQLAIFLDGVIISSPVIQSKISGGSAQINGDFTPEEGRDLVNNLNFGALPVPIELINTQTVGATLGQQTLILGAQALLLSIMFVIVFMIVFYRLPGLIAGISLVTYVFLMLGIFKLIPVVLTGAGIAGFVLSLGMAVDANILIFERIKEELDKGRTLIDSIKDGFTNAWSSIRDGNITSIIAAVIMYWFSDVSLVKGFALVFGLGVMLSMFSAMVVSKMLMLAIAKQDIGPVGRFLYSKGFTNIKK
jgi:preprotein translocase subunit SecD